MFIKIKYLFILCLLTLMVAGDEDEPTYLCSVSEIIGCDNFKNKFILTNLTFQLTFNEDTEDHEMEIGGYIDSEEDINEDVQIDIRLEKDTENGKELVFSASSDFCEGMKQKGCPYCMALESLGIKECPVKAGRHSILEGKKMTINMNEMKHLMNRDNCGEYISRTTLASAKDPTNMLSCYDVKLSMEEKVSKK